MEMLILSTEFVQNFCAKQHMKPVFPAFRKAENAVSCLAKWLIKAFNQAKQL